MTLPRSDVERCRSPELKPTPLPTLNAPTFPGPLVRTLSLSFRRSQMGQNTVRCQKYHHALLAGAAWATGPPGQGIPFQTHRQQSAL